MAGAIERFLHVEAASGVVLLTAALVAVVWASSPWRALYHHLWELPLRIGAGSLTFTASLHFVVNDGLMTLFFFVVGLEIRREIHGGELSDARRAALPLLAAVGGMVLPALVYLAVNRDPATRGGWGVPMATDIAFAVGVLALLGKRVPAGLRVLLLALAIIDDIGAIVVIAVFYSGGIRWAWLALSIAPVLLVLGMQRAGVRRAAAYLPAGVLLWVAFAKSGVHPTLAGVVLGLLTPATAWLGGEGFVTRAEDLVGRVRAVVAGGRPEERLLAPLRDIGRARREAVAPVVRLQAALHPWVAFVIMPLFALANAGVEIAPAAFSASVAPAVFAGLVLGKPAGIVLATLAATATRVAALPRRVTWRGIVVLGLVAGIGFTMSIFVAGLAFEERAHLEAAKTAILGATVVAGLAGLLLGRFVLESPAAPDVSPSEAEASTTE